MATTSQIDLDRVTQESMRLSSLFMQINIERFPSIFIPNGSPSKQSPGTLMPKLYNERSNNKDLTLFQSKTSLATKAFFSFLIKDDHVPYHIKIQAIEQTLAVIQTGLATFNEKQKASPFPNGKSPSFTDPDLLIELASSFATSSWELQNDTQVINHSPSLVPGPVDATKFKR